ncbi:MAG: peptidase S41 [Alistipes sp.]|nr:peptidase S41 [Alistipes sp.]
MKLELPNSIFFAEVERLLGQGQCVTIPVKGHSMRPMMHNERDKVTLTPCNEEQIEVGAVVLFRHHNGHIMHRICAIDGEKVTFAGDGNYRTKEQAERKDIVAKVVSITRLSGQVIKLDSARWRIYSALWLSTPAIVRRYILAITFRLKIWI